MGHSNQRIGFSTQRLLRTSMAMGIAAAVGATAMPASGLNIIPVFNSGASDAPAYDASGSGLTAMFDYAETYYQDIFEDSHTITINFWYDNLSGLLGQHSLVTQSGGRETVANIRINTPTSWFIDPTPSSDSEFTMNQTLWRDINGTQKADWYTFGASDIPETFEVGYTGSATAGGGAQGVTDMLSVVLHEVGHALGMSAGNTSTVSQTNDGDYDFNTNFVFGQTFAVETANNSSDDNLNIAHVENSNMLMNPTIGTSLRRRPSHGDFFAMASGHSYVNLDVPRREFYGNSNWQNSNNWSGNTSPGSADDVYVRDAQGSGTTLTAGLTANGSAANIFVSEGARIDTNGFKLDASRDVTISEANSRAYINPSGELEADEVFIKDTAQVRMSGGILDVRRLIIDAGTSLESFGAGTPTVTVDDLLRNEGLIDTDESVGVGSNLSFSATDLGAHPNPWDLDGTSGDGELSANGGDILFNSGGMSDSFDGLITVGGGYRFHFASAWTNQTGILRLNGGTVFADRARITGGTITFTGGTIDANRGSTAAIAYIDSGINISGGTIDVGIDDRLEFNGTTTVSGGTFNLLQDAALDFDGSLNISGGTFNTASTSNADGVVRFDGTTTYSGGTININGVAQQNGSATVSTDTTINADVFDLDGFSGNTIWTLNKTLTLNIDNNIDTGNNLFNGTLNINNPGILQIGSTTGGAIQVNLPGSDEWTMAGTANVDGSLPGGFTVFIPSVFQGSDVNITGTVNVQDRAGSSARVDLSGNVTTADASSLFRFTGGTLVDPNRLIGGQITGPGTTGATAGRALVGFGTVATSIDFDGTAELRADDGTLIINGSLLVDVGTIGTADTDGVLSVTGSWNSDKADKVELLGGSIVGGTLTNGSGSTDGLITGHGTLAPSQVRNDGIISADGGLLIINTTSAPDLDGLTGDGVLHAVAGDMRIVDNVTDFFDGTARIGATRTMTFSNGWTLNSGGELNVIGGGNNANRAVLNGSTQSLRGTVVAIGEAHFEILTSFTSTANVSIPIVVDKLRLFEDTSIAAGATFTGAGTLIVASSAALTLADGVDLDVNVSNAGDLIIGSSPGEATVRGYSQTKLGSLVMETQGTGAGQFDRLIVDNTASFAGTLSFKAIGGFNPALGNTFDILDFSSSSGMFSNYDLEPLPADQMWSTRRLFTKGVLHVALAGDLNDDGVVDLADFGRLAFNFGAAGSVTTADGDLNLSGKVEKNDFGILAGNFGNSEAVVASAPVPEPGTLGIAMLGLLSLRRRRRSA